jgi:hypothetical protein
MNPIGIMIAFLLFGGVIAIGLTLVVANLRALMARRVVSISAIPTPGYSLADIVGFLTRSLLLLLGVAMVYQGSLWIYTVIFR